MKKKLITSLLTIFILTGCTVAKPDPGPFKADLPYNIEEVTVDIPGEGKEEMLIWLSDLHIAGESSGMDPEKQADIAQRVQYSSCEGITAAAQWDGLYSTTDEYYSWITRINDCGSDLVIFGGDMLDYNYPEGMDLLDYGFKQLKAPFLYARADHDMLPTYMLDQDEQAAKDMQNSLCKNEDVMSYAFDGFYVVVWNNSTSNLSEGGLERIKQLASEGRPMILVTHVPIQPLEDESLDAKSKEVFADRILLWGYRDTYYWPDENTRQLLDMIYGFNGETSPFVEILSGHLHFSWSGMVAPGVHQTVFGAAFEGNMGLIHVK